MYLAMSSSAPNKRVVGPQLKARRQSLRMSLAQVEVATKIRGKYLIALEAGEYEKLPNDIYSRGFVQNYANHLGLDGTVVAADYALERGGIEKGETKGPQLERPAKLVFTGRIVAVIGIVAVVVTVLGYLLWQMSALAGAPRLTITNPDQDLTITGSVVEIRGSATPGSDVFIDTSPVLVDTDGNFAEKVAVQDGINEITVLARSKLGKETKITRNILASIPKVELAQAQVPLVVFDGVAVVVSVKETTSMVVLVDGKEVWRGTVIAGWSRLFTGKDTINITSGNAGATTVQITNKLVAAKDLGIIGAIGEVRRNQIFSKDSTF